MSQAISAPTSSIDDLTFDCKQLDCVMREVQCKTCKHWTAVPESARRIVLRHPDLEPSEAYLIVTLDPDTDADLLVFLHYYNLYDGCDEQIGEVTISPTRIVYTLDDILPGLVSAVRQTKANNRLKHLLS
jgi:hypothetical protein